MQNIALRTLDLLLSPFVQAYLFSRVHSTARRGGSPKDVFLLCPKAPCRGTSLTGMENSVLFVSEVHADVLSDTMNGFHRKDEQEKTCRMRIS